MKRYVVNIDGKQVSVYLAEDVYAFKRKLIYAMRALDICATIAVIVLGIYVGTVMLP